MNGNTMFETASARTTSFDRPSCLRSNLDFGRSAWTNHRNGWNSGTAGAVTNTDADSARPPAQRHSSTSSAKFGRLSNNAPFTPIDNPRSSTTSTGVDWGISTTQASDSRLRSSLTSPTKQAPSSWLFKEPLGDNVENSTLLEGSAPEIDLGENRFRRDSRPSTRGFYGPENHSAVNSDPIGPLSTKAFTTTMHPNFTPAHNKPASNRSVGAFSNVQHGTASNGPSPTSRSFHCGSSLRNVDTSMSPTLSRFNKSTGFDAYLNGSGPGTSAMLEPLTQNLEGLGFGHRTQATNDDLPANHLGVDFVPAIPNSSIVHSNDITPPTIRPTDGYQSSGLTASFPPSFHPSHSHTHSGHQQSIWNYHDQDLQGPVTSDYKQSLGSPYYSATGTPPTGPESIRSAGGSGISSRTSHHDISLLDRKLRSLDLLHPYQTLATNGFLPVHSTGYDLSMHQSTMRMNPLAAPYHVANNNLYGYGYNASLRLPPKEPEQAHVIRSAVLEEFRMSNKTNKRYELRDIFGHVVEFSGDQHGSRFIQLKLETANSDEKDQIFKEIQPNSLQLMTDVFGNYVIQKLFEHGNQSQKKVLANHMKGHVLALSTQMYGCRVVQKAIEHVLTDQQAVIVKELDGPNKQILKVIRDQNGNHVVQKAIERVPAEHIQFIIEAHRGEVVRLATHTYGCRVIQRILEHCQAAGKRVILDELHGCVAPLITDSFGNYVVQHVIQNGEPDDRRRVVSIVQQQLLIFSKHKFASNVVEKCIEYADDDQRAEIVRKLVGHNEQGQSPVLGLLRDQYGNYVIQRIHAVIRGAELEALTNEMKLSFPQLKRTSYGKQVLAIEKLLSGMGSPQSTASDSPTSSTGVSGRQCGRSEYLPSTPSYLPGAGQGQGHLPGHSPMIIAEQR